MQPAESPSFDRRREENCVCSLNLLREIIAPPRAAINCFNKPSELSLAAGARVAEREQQRNGAAQDAGLLHQIILS